MTNGMMAYARQLENGLITSNLSDQVSWGAYIANFTFLVGVAAAAVLLVVPAYLYKREDIKKVVLFGELLALSAIIMCLLFVTVDLGQPQRFIHLLPLVGKINFPHSILAWDVLVLNGYLLLNLHIPGYLLYKKYLGEKPNRKYYMPFVYLSIAWAVSIHTVTAFLFSGFAGRPFWNSAVLAPRFLISAFAAGPALLIIVLAVKDRFSTIKTDSSVTGYLSHIIAYTLPANIFLFACEIFTELYSDTTHAISVKYLFMGLGGHGMIIPYIWSAVIFNLTAALIFMTPSMRKKRSMLIFASALCFVGIWIEKGMGLIVPGFLPTPLGDLVEYTPSMTEISVCAGIWAIGGLLFTLFAKVANGIDEGQLTYNTSRTL